MSSSIVKVEDFAIMKADRDAVRDMVEANLGGGEITEFDLPRAKMPSGEMPAFVFNSGGGKPEMLTEIVGVIVYHADRRAYWSQGLDEGGGGTPPDCWSPDAMKGIGMIAEKYGGNCKTCPMAAFGSSHKRDGTPGRGQACQQRKMIFILIKDRILPIVLSVPPSSLKRVRTYMTSLVSAGLPVHNVLTRLTLAATKNADGTAFCNLDLEMAGQLEDAAAASMNSFRQMFSAMFRAKQPQSQGEYVEATAGGEKVENPNG